MDIIKSKLRIEFLIGQSFIFLITLFLLILCIHLSTKYGPIDFQNPFLWLVFLVFPLLIISFLKFLFEELKQISVSQSGIEIKYIVSKRTSFVKYNEIIRITPSWNAVNSGTEIAGHQELQIELLDERIITITENQFENYLQLKVSIRNYFKDQT